MPGDKFYSTLEWIKLRSKVKARWKRMGLPCGYCGLPIDWDAKPIADHIQNRKKYPRLALVESNIQMVHHECNTKKSKYVESNDKVAIGLDGLPADGSWG